MNTAYKCLLCKRKVPTLIYFSEEQIALCPNCGEQLYTCRGCVHRECEADKNLLNIPPYIIKEINQGGNIIRGQMSNPAIKEAYCKKCICSLGQEICMRPLERCEHWSLHPDYTKEELMK